MAEDHRMKEERQERTINRLHRRIEELNTHNVNLDRQLHRLIEDRSNHLIECQSNKVFFSVLFFFFFFLKKNPFYSFVCSIT